MVGNLVSLLNMFFLSFITPENFLYAHSIHSTTTAIRVPKFEIQHHGCDYDI